MQPRVTPARSNAALLVGVLALLWLWAGVAGAAVFSGIEYGNDGDDALHLDVRTPARPGPYPVWVEWVERDSSALIVPDREVHAADTVLVRASMPARAQARRLAAAQLLEWLPKSLSGYGGDPDRVILIVHGSGAQAVLDLWSEQRSRGTTPPPRSVRALVVVAPPDDLKGHADWPDLPLLLIDAPARADALWRTTLRLRNRGLAVEPLVQESQPAASRALSAQVAAMLAATEVPRVQRFDQLAFGSPLRFDARLLDAVARGSELIGLFFDQAARSVRLSAIDDDGATRPLARWPWRDDARLFLVGEKLLVVGSDAQGQARMQVERGAGDWQSLAIHGIRGRVRFAASAQRGNQAIAVAWTRESGKSFRSASRLLRVARVDGSVSITGTRDVDAETAALAWVSDDVIVATRGSKSEDRGGDPRATSLLRWAPASGAIAHVPGAGSSPWQALLAPPGDTSVLLGLREGRLHRLDFSCNPLCVSPEPDVLQSTGLPGTPSKTLLSLRGQELRHPETGDSLLALLPRAAGTAQQSTSWFVRQRSGRYGIAQLPESERLSGGAVRAIVPWSRRGDEHRYAVFASNEARTLLFPASLERASIVPGMWWDPARSGHGFDLRRVDRGWQVTVYTFDRKGLPVWYRGDGDIRDGRWQASADGLLRYRMRSKQVEIDRADPVSLALTFEPEANAACSERPRGKSFAHATLELGTETSDFCLQPLPLAAEGRPGIDIDGVWSARDEVTPWQLAFTTQGFDPRARISALLTYFDRAGVPRWAFAANDWQGGAAEFALLWVRGACATCGSRASSSRPVAPRPVGRLILRASGECGAARVNASLRVTDATGFTGMPTGTVELAPTALLGCY